MLPLKCNLDAISPNYDTLTGFNYLNYNPAEKRFIQYTLPSVAQNITLGAHKVCQSVHLPPIVEEHRIVEILIFHPIILGAEFSILGAGKLERADEIAGNVVSLDGDSGHVSGAFDFITINPRTGSRNP